MATPTTDHQHEACTEAHTSGPFAGGAIHCVECGELLSTPCGWCDAPVPVADHGQVAYCSDAHRANDRAPQAIR
jgi:hypothetical protein